jgi:site-specific recombinase XerD
MNFKPILWTYEPRKDGSCAVKIYGKKKYFQTGVAVDPQQWDDKNGKVLRAHPLHAQMNALIHAKILELEKNLLEGNELPTKTNLKAQAAQAKKSNIVEFIQVHIDEVAKGVHEVSPGTLAHYESLILRLTQFTQYRGVPHWTWSDINLSWYGDFWQFLHQSFGIQKTGGFANHIKFLKKFMTLAKREKLHQNEVHYEPEFKVHKSKEQKIYLTEQEVDTIENLDLSTMTWLEVERDRWMVCYYFLLRYQDGQDHIRRENFFASGNRFFFRYDAQKTKINATIPVKPKVLELLEKYNYKLPKTTNQEANRKIKMIASIAGINTLTQENGKKGPKCSFVRTHTTRRSAATNLAMQGVPLDFIAKLGGWKKLETLKKYLLASGLDVAMVAAEYEFFR